MDPIIPSSSCWHQASVVMSSSLADLCPSALEHVVLAHTGDPLVGGLGSRVESRPLIPGPSAK